MTPTDVEAQPVPLEHISTASTSPRTSLGEHEHHHHHHGADLDQALSRIQTWALEYVDLDFSTSCSSTLPGLNLHASPADWPLARKVRALVFPCLAALLAGYAAGSYAFAGTPLKQAWSLSPAAYNTGITTFVLGFGLAPVVLALLSEIYGRYWIFVSCGVVFLLGTAGCAVTTSFAGMLVARFITGAGASVFATLTAGVVSDLFPGAAERSTPMALYSLCLCAGTGVGPLVSGAIAARAAVAVPDEEDGRLLSWRWIFYIQMMLIAAVTVAVALVFEETRANVLLARNCRVLNEHIDELEKDGSVVCDRDLLNDAGSGVPAPGRSQQQKRTRFRVPHPSSSSSASARPPSLLAQVWRSLCFPLQLLVTEPIVSCFSAWVSFAWAILYMQFATIPRVFRDVHGFDDLQLGLAYIAVIAGCLLGCGLCIAQDKMARSVAVVNVASRARMWLTHRNEAAGTTHDEEKQDPNTSHDNKKSPESRIYFACLGTILLPAGLFMFGWTTTASSSSEASAAQTPDFHPIVPTIAIALSVTGIFIIYLAVFNYLADAYGRFASSAQAAQSLCRNVLAGVLPLVADAMYDRLGYAGGESLLGGIAVVLCLVPWVLCVFGERIRARSLFAKELGR
ncbi:major facilitator superfamily domain-containing protein [Microdochium trichocladiopsis]|uniref:Major facilitator superfamily domain-containing protein n=1 Tax=Microdochium trichocladiopsis TaxID=1682393 RepID=A0A9P8XYS2_9PEZI|nr:major facilitator superfamily domain-containing protein [Microdochium trichocladiopsis]KAH7025024.1 major facilitator superfamily domain-containing protein [Microdochium trichocladiopsis]